MPANLSPEYKAAEAELRKARDPEARLHWLREMLRTIPKHKGTDYLQAEIKTRIKQLTEELAGPRKGGAHGGPVTVIRPEGAAQIALIGPPNSGKSALHAALTHSHAQTAPYAFTTQYPRPGMLPFEDAHFQLLDLPPIDPEPPIPWIGGSLQQTDACLLAVDLSAPDSVDRVLTLHEELGRWRVYLTRHRLGTTPEARREIPEDPFALLLPTLMLATKADLIPQPGRRAQGLPRADWARLPVPPRLGGDGPRAGCDRRLAVPGAGHRAGLHQVAGTAVRSGPALHPTPRRHGGRRGAAGAQGLRRGLRICPPLAEGRR